MAVVIRLSVGGAKNRPFYKIMVADKRYPRDGRFIEKLGTLNPNLPKDSPERLKLNTDRLNYWLSKGATPSETLAKLFSKNGIENKSIKNILAKRQVSIKKKQAKQKIEAELTAKKAAKEAAKEAKKAAAGAAAAAPAPAAEAPAAQ